MPLFPLDMAVLLPQQILPLHIFEPRYRQMVEQALDTNGQFAMAVFAGTEWKKNYHGRPPLRPAVCIGQIMQHDKQEDGTYNILLQGVCRGRIVEEQTASADRLYRAARLAPIGVDPQEDTKLYGVRERLSELLSDGPLSRLSHAEWVVKRIRDDAIPTSVIMELVSFALPTAKEVRYNLLAEGDAGQRADLIEHELLDLQSLIQRAGMQHPESWPKGCSWN